VSSDDLTKITQPSAAETRLADDVASVESNEAQTTQFTQYSASHNHSAGFAKAKQLVEQSVKGDGVGRLLKKRFLLESVLGHGGMGTVYKARDLRKVEAEDPNPYIATKVLNQDFRDHPDAFITLQQETAKSQTLAHPNIVTVHDFDRDGDTLYMTMELLEGEPLDQLIHKHKDKGLPKEKVWSITRDLSAALSYAHQRHLIHADFKPGNIFVTSDGHAKVLDFGIARAASKEAQKHKFDAGQLGALTPAYATIEMINDEPISFSDDVYALACVVYETLVGRHPYNHRSALDALAKDIKPKRPAQLNNTEWKVLQRGLALKKKDRYATIDEFSAALFPKSLSLGVKLALGLALVLSLGGGWFAYQQFQSQQELQLNFNKKMTDAQNCFDKKDFECAVAASMVAVNLNPDSQAAKDLLKQSQTAEAANQKNKQITRLLKEANACVESQDAACVQVKSRDILTLDPKHPQGLELAKQANQMSDQDAVESWLAEGKTCLDQGDVSCARMFLEKAVAVDKNSVAVQEFSGHITSIEAKHAEKLQQQELRMLMRS
jgi:serine/threonine protein kinase